ncbi:TetR/AcrR family transcriptional regulator [Nocardioides zeae]|uniref:TetR/AcrR family transcriptional regulator n=1 Tax=Nocardioides imazamoxiresistens TaxID=3231893 RepID=A0ABU3Q0U5_9ACTN|nr:TetR/AcrR family transcriptional regulator [Nocardioides zeae]MDT9594645.1 TetR/AcrR family transcriptional regulator [Nocardioides zeae]
MSTRPSTERKLLDAADELLFGRGVATTTVDELLALAGVSPATLYRAYGSKDGLLVAALQRRQSRWLEVWDDAVAAATGPAEALLSVFDALATFRAQPHGARWCAFLGSAAEYADPPAPLAAALRADTEHLRSRLRDLAGPLVDGDAARAARLADALLLVVSGELAMQLREPGSRTASARAVARAVLDAELSGAPA